MEIRTGALSFQHARGSGPRSAERSFIFPRPVRLAVAGLGGFSAGFFRSDGDHELGIIQVELATRIESNVVIATGTYGLRDWSGNWDDEYEGVIDIIVLAELEDARLPPPRGDLIISGIEVNQATQAFRSHLELDAANVRPDNSIPLVARKATGLRLYVDYDASAGLPPIPTLSGEVDVITSLGGTTSTLQPQQTITPRRDSQIDRGMVGHTLNFVIPEALCQGDLTIRARVFDAANPASGSAAFQMPLSFRDVEELRLVAVQVRYTGQGMDATPTQAAILSALSFTETTYPIPEVFVTGFQNLTFSEDFSPSGSGCGSAYSNLLDDLDDLVGDADELVFGFLPTGITFGPAVGCGRAGIGAGPISRQDTIAHELGHALGRKHAPTCGNADENFPQFGSFPTGSIGEFGYDTRNNVVFDPASFFDFMCGRPRWISPYTYNALADKFPPVEFSTFASAFSLLRAAYVQPRVEIGTPRSRQKLERLFLGLEIARDRTVTRRPSFHYPAPAARATGTPTAFTAEFSDEEDKVLACSVLHDICITCEGTCWPKTIRSRVPFPPGARHLRVFEDREEIFHEKIPDPPEVQARSVFDEKKRALLMQWKSDDEDLWYLAQWRDRDGTWRCVGPRTQQREMAIPLHLFGHRSTLPVRVLATSGIATGVAEIEVGRPRAAPEPTVEIVEVTPPTTGPRASVEVRAIRSDGGSIPDADLIWFDDVGNEIGRGRRVDLSSYRPGEHLVRAVLRNTGFGQAERSLVVKVGPAEPPDKEEGDGWWPPKRRAKGG